MANMNSPVNSQVAANVENARRSNGRFGFQDHLQGTSSLQGAGGTATLAPAQEARWETLSMEQFHAEQTPESRRNQMSFEVARGLSDNNGTDMWAGMDEAEAFLQKSPEKAEAMVAERNLDAPVNFGTENLPVISGGESLAEMEVIAYRNTQLWQADLTALYVGAEKARAEGIDNTGDHVRHNNIMATVALNERTAPEVLDRVVDTYLDGDLSFSRHARNALLNANTSEDTLKKALRRSNEVQTSDIARDMLERRYEDVKPTIFQWAEFKALGFISDVKSAKRALS